MKASSEQGATVDERVIRRALERAELVSTGVALVGAGLALIFSDQLAPFTVPILAFGLVLHGVAMYGKRRIESRANVPRERWIEALYWICWFALGGLALLVFTR